MQEPIKIDPAPQYERQVFWVVLPTNGYGEPKVRKTEPDRLGSNELALCLHLRVPKRSKRLAQTIEITLPEEFSHIAKIEVAVPEVTEK